MSVRRQGFTLIELIVTVAVIALLSSVATLALRTAPPPTDDQTTTRVAAARRRAVEAGAPTTIVIVRGDTAYSATAFPDGSMVADTALHVDQLTGRSIDARR